MPTKKFIELSGHERQTPTILPPSGHRNLYAKDDGWYEMDDAGVETKLTNEASGSSYLVYVAILNQTGTNAPVPTVLENTIGNIVWEYNTTGTYNAVLEDAFPSNKTVIFITNNYGDDTVLRADNDNGAPDQIVISSYRPVDAAANGILYQTPIEIRVYP